MRAALGILLVLALLPVSGLPVSGLAAAGEAKQGHPHFDDKGSIRWFTKLADAKAAAKKEGKLIFIEYGREA